MSNPYHIKSGPHGGEFTHGPDSAKAKETKKRHYSEDPSSMITDLQNHQSRVGTRHKISTWGPTVETI